MTTAASADDRRFREQSSARDPPMTSEGRATRRFQHALAIGSPRLVRAGSPPALPRIGLAGGRRHPARDRAEPNPRTTSCAGLARGWPPKDRTSASARSRTPPRRSTHSRTSLLPEPPSPRSAGRRPYQRPLRSSSTGRDPPVAGTGAPQNEGANPNRSSLTRGVSCTVARKAVRPFVRHVARDKVWVPRSGSPTAIDSSLERAEAAPP